MAALSELAARQRPIRRTARTSNTILAGADCGKWFDITSGTFSQTFTAAATLGSSWWVWYTNSGSGTVTLDPNSSETIAGASTYALGPGQGGVISSDGTNLQIIPFLNVPGVTAAGLALLDDASAADQRTTLGIGLTLIESINTTSGTTAVFDDIPATYKRLWLILNGVSATGAMSLDFDYSVNNGGAWTEAWQFAAHGAAGDTMDAIVRIDNYGAAGIVWFQGTTSISGATPTHAMDVFTIADNIDALRLDTGGGVDFDAGTATLYGES